MKTISFSALMAAPAMAATAQSTNVQTVQDIYECFTKGDIPGILNVLASDVVWVHPGNPDVLPFAGTYRGLGEVAGFFQAVGQSLQFTVFHPSNYRQNGKTISNDMRLEAIVLPTNTPYGVDAIFNWTFNEEGKVSHWEYTGDVSGLEAAFQQ